MTRSSRPPYRSYQRLAATLLFIALMSDMQASMLSDAFSRVNSGFNHFRSVIYDPSARVAAISTIDKEIDAARKLIRSLSNSLASTSLLPPEILARIFHFLSLEEPSYSGKQNLGWIGVTHVCQLWRKIALGDSSLWANITKVPTNTVWFSEMLARARSAPLDIDIDPGKNPEVLFMFLSHLSHIRALSLRSISALQSDGFRGICCREAPTLEHFILEGSFTPLFTFPELGGTTLFKGRAPRLRTFRLSEVFIPWSLIPRGQLTYLEISLDDEAFFSANFSHGDSNQMIDLLVNCPGLEFLLLERCIPFELAQSTGTHGRTVRLPCLSGLCLVGSSSRIINLLKMLKPPPLISLVLFCTNNLAYNVRQLLPVISTHLQSPALVEPKNFRVTTGIDESDRWFQVATSNFLPTTRVRKSRKFQGFESSVFENDWFTLIFHNLPKPDETDLIENVCKMLPISNIEFLSISIANEGDPVNWVQILKSCTKVTTMQAIGRRTSNLVRALTTPDLKTRPGRKGKKKRHNDRDGTNVSGAQLAIHFPTHAHAPIFPKLEFLSLKRLDFAEDDGLSGLLFDVVEKGLQQRKLAYSTPLKMLRIDNCAISAKRARALEKLVQKFHWDGEESFGDYDWDFDELGWWKEFFDDTI